MARLHNKMGLRDNLLEKLNENKIFTVLDFLSESSEKLSALTNTSFKEIREIRHNLLTSSSALPLSGTMSYEHLLSSSALIPSGINGLDELLHGGFLTGTVLEVCGLSGEGKTQLCLSVSAHVAASLMQVVHYLDTKGDFSASRVSDIIKNKDINEEECKVALERIFVTKVDDIYGLIQYLHYLKSSLSEDESSPPRVVVVDSMPALYFPFMGCEGNQGLGLLNHVMTMMKALATEYHVLFIEVNLASTFVETEFGDAETNDEGKDQVSTNDVRPMLGKYWLHAPNMRLLISRLNNEVPQRLIRITKSTYLPLGASCVVSISEQGVV